MKPGKKCVVYCRKECLPIKNKMAFETNWVLIMLKCPRSMETQV